MTLVSFDVGGDCVKIIEGGRTVKLKAENQLNVKVTKLEG